MAFVLSFALSHRIAAVGAPAVAHARTNGFSLGVVLYEMLFDAPAGRVTDETGLGLNGEGWLLHAKCYWGKRQVKLDASSMLPVPL